VKHLDGICHTYIHADAKPEMAQEIIVNAKMRVLVFVGQQKHY